ncbi:MAG: HAMP domain-containing histidine kinase [Clostridia bacterium]|nr:HAMP domain-containing histidine kinase [Clostridia bacterium]
MKKTSEKRPVLNRIRTKMFISLFAILTVFFGVICFVAGPALSTVLIYRTYNNLKEISEEIDMVSPGSSTYYFDLYTIAVNNNISFELINQDDTISYQSSDGYSAQSSAHIYSSSSSDSDYLQTENITTYNFKNDSGKYERRRKIATRAEYLVYTDTLSSNETIHIFSSVAIIDSNVEVATRVFILICVFIALLMLLFVYRFISRFTKPLEEMNDITKDMANLNFARKCTPYRKDEIGELGENINVLSTTLDSTLHDLRQKNLQLETDIEHRREFISNVSHELKTPIAIISGYAEGLSSGISDDPSVIKEYCEIINEESKKMNGLVVELLELSKFESFSETLKPVIYNISEQIKDVVSHFSLLISEKGITVDNRITNDIFCSAQKEKIEIILKNYISNAISHCKNEMLIRLECDDCKDRWKIKIFNSGENIDESDINRIWESFYRADKAHSRNENRYGLGLSIVKAIADNHGMNCSVQNDAGGVTFDFEVQKAEGISGE